MGRDFTVNNHYAVTTPGYDRVVSPQVAGLNEVIGRDQELADLRAAFTAAHAARAPVVQIVTGMGGVGKTSLARAYAQRHLDDYAVIWWVRAEDLNTVDGEYRGLLEVVYSTGEAKLVRDAVRLANVWLSEQSAPWLLVLDNVLDVGALGGLFPARGNGHVLVTSQANQWPNPTIVRHLLPLDKDASVELLTTVSQDTDTETAAVLAEELDGLPLALRQAASFTAANGIDLATYLRFYRERSPDLHTENQPDDYPHTVATTWLLAIDQLSASARQILVTIAYVAPDSIPISLLQPLIDDEFALIRAIGELLSHSLVTRGPEGAVTVHRLVQAVTRHHFGDVVRHASRARDLLLAALPEPPLNLQRIDIWNRLRNHAFAVANYLPTDPLTFDLRHRLAFLHEDNGDMRVAQIQFQSLIRDMTPLLGPDDERVLRARNGLAHCHVLFDMKGARDSLADLLDVQTRVLGVENPDTLMTWNDLVAVCLALGDSDGAGQMLEELIPLNARVLGPTHRETLFSRSYLGDSLGRRGRYGEALKLYNDVMVDATNAFGETHPDTITLRMKYAASLGEAGDPAAARDLFELVVEQSAAQRGKYAKSTLIAHIPLSYWTTMAGNPARGIQMLLRMLTRLRVSLGKNDPMVKQFEDGLDSIRSGRRPGTGKKKPDKKRKR